MAKARQMAVGLLLGLIVLGGAALRVWYGCFGLRIDRFQDEQYSWPNVESILVGGTLEPARPFYPQPLFNLPPALLIAAAEEWAERRGHSLSVTDAGGSVSPWALFLCRLWPMLYGIGAVVLVFIIGKKLFSTGAALLAALLLAFSPFAIHSSGYFKPDSQLLFMTLAAFALSLRAVERASLASYALAGGGFALVLSSKWVGMPIAAPLVLATLACGWSSGRAWKKLGAAAGTSGVVFLAINPYWSQYWDHLGQVREHYRNQAAWLGSTRLEVPKRTLEWLLGGMLQSSWFIVLGLLGLLGLGLWLIRQRRDCNTHWQKRLMFVAFPLVYVGVYAAVTARFKGNNMLPIGPFLMLGASGLLWTLWQRGSLGWPDRRRKVLGYPAAFLVVLPGLLPGVDSTYSSLVPTTNHLARDFLARSLRPPDGRLVYFEPAEVRRPGWEGWPRDFARQRAGLEEVENLLEVSIEELGLADGFAFPASRAAGPGGESLQRWMEAVGPRQVWVARSRLFRARGPSMVAIRQPKRSLGPPVSLAMQQSAEDVSLLVAELPADIAVGEMLSFVIEVPRDVVSSWREPPGLQLGGRHIDWVWVPVLRRTSFFRFVTERHLIAGNGNRRLEIDTEGMAARPSDFRIQCFLWESR